MRECEREDLNGEFETESETLSSLPEFGANARKGMANAREGEQRI